MKKSRLLMLLLALAIVGTVAAAPYVVLQWQANFTVADNPKVSFFVWSTSAKENTMTYTANIFPNVKTVEENHTRGIWNWDTADHTIYFRLASENTNSTDIAWLYYKVYNATATLYSKNETDFNSPSTSWSSAVTIPDGAKYAIWIECKAGASAGTGHTPSVTFELKVENP